MATPATGRCRQLRPVYRQGWWHLANPTLPPKEALKAPQASRGVRRRTPWPEGPHDMFSSEDVVVGGLRTFPNPRGFGKVRGYAANPL